MRRPEPGDLVIVQTLQGPQRRIVTRVADLGPFVAIETVTDPEDDRLPETREEG